MKKILISNTLRSNESSKHNALSKAREDVIRTFDEMGGANLIIRRFPIENKFLRGILNLIYSYWQVLCFKRKIHKGDRVYIQYPTYSYVDNLLQKIIHGAGATSCLIVHDIETLRKKLPVENELNYIFKADELVTLNDTMTRYFWDKGYKKPMRAMHIWDYYTEDPLKNVDVLLKSKHVVCFAGNLDKSSFISHLIKANLGDIHVNLYGLMDASEISLKSCCSYCGMFAPDHPAIVKGGWGLVWDGDSLETCSGGTGDYLRINSSHKFSMYVSVGIPLIVWNQSALAHFVERYNIGITISSIYEIDKRIKSISHNDYLSILNSVRKLSRHVRNGEMLKAVAI